MKTTKFSFIKHISISLILIPTISYYLSAISFAASPTPLPSQNQISSDSADLEKIQKIKDIVASKVKELKLVEKRGIIGTVRETSSMAIVVVDIKGDTRHIDIDELTKFNLGSKSTYDISDIQKGETYSFIGLYNKDTQKLLARDVETANTVPAYFEGAVSSVDSKNFQLEVVNAKGEKRNVDIENSTKTSLATTDGDLERSGFSKLAMNERVLAIGFWDKKDSTLLSALRVIHFSQIPPSKEMQSFVTASASAK